MVGSGAYASGARKSAALMSGSPGDREVARAACRDPRARRHTHRRRNAAPRRRHREPAEPASRDAGACCVIGREISRVAEGLVKGGARGVKGALQFKHGHAAALQDDDVRTSRIARQLVLKDGGVLVAAVSRTSSSRHSRCSHGIDWSQARICSGEASETNCCSWRRTIARLGTGEGHPGDCHP